jgi:hypothetical protein
LIIDVIAAIGYGREDPFLALFYGAFGKPYSGPSGEASGDIHLDMDGVGIHAHQTGGEEGGHGHALLQSKLCATVLDYAQMKGRKPMRRRYGETAIRGYGERGIFLSFKSPSLRLTVSLVRNPIIVVRFSVERGALLVQPLGGEVTLGIECRHATHARGGNGLAIDVVDAVPGGEDTGHAGLSAIFGKDVTLFIGLDLV